MFHTHMHTHIHTHRPKKKLVHIIHAYVKSQHVCVDSLTHAWPCLEAPVKTNRYASSLSSRMPGKPLFVFVCVCVCVCVSTGDPTPKPFVQRGSPDELVVSLYFLSSPLLLFLSTSLSALLHLILSASIPEMAQIAAEAKLPVIKHLQ